MKTIFFILPNLDLGGAERIITILINNLDKKLFKPKLILLKKEGYYLDLLDPNTEIIELKKKRIRQIFFSLIQLIFKHKPDIVFGGWGEISAFISPIIPFFPKIKFITRETNIVTEYVQRAEIKFFYRFYNNYKKIIVQSDDMQQDLIENLKIKPSKLLKINNPIDFNLINKKLKESIKLPYESSYKNLIAIGNLSYRKGFDNLLKVFYFLKQENIKLYILGDGVDRDILKQQADELNLSNIYFLGKKNNPYPYLKNADLFILSSRFEGFPNVLLEAGACGTYALANDCKGGIHEIIQPGVNGNIFNIEEHEKFAQEIIRILTIKKDKQKIIDSIKKRFSKDIIMLQYEKMFTTL